jgi:uncharacterized Zn-binding protein involved in type VI secretion
MQPMIVQGDKTSHHGTVLEGSPHSDSHGKPIARVGDKVSCPKCMGIFPIAEGDNSNIIDGAPVAYHGCKTSCGAILISSQMFTLTNPSSGAAPGADASGDSGEALARFGAVGAGMVAAYEDEPVDSEGQRFKGRFQVLDRNSGEPVAATNVRVRSTEGQYLTGQTDGDGYTQWVERDANEALAFDLVEPEA